MGFPASAGLGGPIIRSISQLVKSKSAMAASAQFLINSGRFPDYFRPNSGLIFAGLLLPPLLR